MKKYFLRSLSIYLVLVKSTVCIQAQTFGANSPTTTGNNAAVGGTLAWTSPGNVVSSNDSYATNINKGTTQYISATGFGFNIPATTIINGIQLDIERSTASPTIVSILDNWTPGTTKTISSGASRMLLFMASMENGNGSRDITALRYGGQAMTQIVQAEVGSGFSAKLEFWVLLETGIAAAVGSAFTMTFAAATLTENVEYYASAVYAGVDQVLPYTTTASYTQSSATNPFTVTPTLPTTGGGMAVAAIHSGNPPGGTYSIGSNNLAYITGGGFTEVIDTYTAAATFSTSGMCTGISHQPIVSAGTVAPVYNFSGTLNRQVVIYVNLTCINELDNSVRLIKGGTITGSDLAYTSSPWNTVDTYTTYGGASTLWGTTWINTDLNAANFGAVISATVKNGNARVDHMRVTVYATSTVPIELLDFLGENVKGKNRLRWRTASELNNLSFEIERKTSLDDFVKIASIDGKGTTTALNEYNFTDEEPPAGISYYRLKQIDLDGTYKYSSLIFIDRDNEHTEPLVYPNPSHTGLFNVNIDEARTRDILIYTSDMKLIKTLSVDSDAWDFSLKELADGSYYVLLNTSTGQTIKRIEKICR